MCSGVGALLALMLLPPCTWAASRRNDDGRPATERELGHARRLAQALYATGDGKRRAGPLRWTRQPERDLGGRRPLPTQRGRPPGPRCARCCPWPKSARNLATLFRDRWVGVGLILSWLFLLAAVGAALWPFLRTAYAGHRASAAREEDYLASLPPEVLEQLVALAQERQALGQPAGGPAASWQAAAAQVAAQGCRSSRPITCPAGRRSTSNAEAAPPRPPASSHVPTWQPAAPAGGASPPHTRAQPEPQPAQPGPQPAAPEAPPAGAAPEASRAESRPPRTLPSGGGPPAPPEQEPAPPSGRARANAERPVAEQETEEVASRRQHLATCPAEPRRTSFVTS